MHYFLPHSYVTTNMLDQAVIILFFVISLTRNQEKKTVSENDLPMEVD